MLLIVTGYVAAAFALQVPKGYNQENLVLGLIYAFFVLYILFSYVPITILTKPFLRAVSFVGAPIMRLRPMYRKMLYIAFVAAVIIVVVFSIPPSSHSTRVQRLIGLFGLVVFVACLYATSHVRTCCLHPFASVCICLHLSNVRRCRTAKLSIGTLSRVVSLSNSFSVSLCSVPLLVMICSSGLPTLLKVILLNPHTVHPSCSVKTLPTRACSL